LPEKEKRGPSPRPRGEKKTHFTVMEKRKRFSLRKKKKLAAPLGGERKNSKSRRKV